MFSNTRKKTEEKYAQKNHSRFINKMKKKKIKQNEVKTVVTFNEYLMDLKENQTL